MVNNKKKRITIKKNNNQFVKIIQYRKRKGNRKNKIYGKQ